MDLEHEGRLVEVETKLDNTITRVNELEKRQDNLDELVGAVKVLAVREEKVENDVEGIKMDVKTLTGKSGQRWDSLMDKIFMTVVAAIAGFILAKLGL